MYLFPYKIYQLGRGLVRRVGRVQMRTGIYAGDSSSTDRNNLGSLGQNEEVI